MQYYNSYLRNSIQKDAWSGVPMLWCTSPGWRGKVLVWCYRSLHYHRHPSSQWRGVFPLVVSAAPDVDLSLTGRCTLLVVMTSVWYGCHGTGLLRAEKTTKKIVDTLTSSKSFHFDQINRSTNLIKSLIFFTELVHQEAIVFTQIYAFCTYPTISRMIIV